MEGVFMIILVLESEKGFARPNSSLFRQDNTYVWDISSAKF